MNFYGMKCIAFLCMYTHVFVCACVIWGCNSICSNKNLSLCSYFCIFVTRSSQHPTGPTGWMKQEVLQMMEYLPLLATPLHSVILSVVTLPVKVWLLSHLLAIVFLHYHLAAFKVWSPPHHLGTLSSHHPLAAVGLLHPRKTLFPYPSLAALLPHHPLVKFLASRRMHW